VENRRDRFGFVRRTIGEIEKYKQRTGFDFFCNAKGWFNETIMIAWMKRHFQFSTPGPKLLLLDDFSVHKTPGVQACAASMNVHILFIPPGLTGVCQPADLAWNRPLKQMLREQWQSFMMAQIENSDLQKWKLKAPGREEIVKWMEHAWSKTKPSTIANGFRAAKLPCASFDSSPEDSDQDRGSLGLQELLSALADLDLLVDEQGESQDDQESPCSASDDA
jgi:hypothetical protein